jgi:serine O-acetyltransferase
MGQGVYLCASSGVVIGETATVGNDVSILHGVTLGGTGKETGDRHPKIDAGVILQDSATVLGNINVGEGAVVTAKAIVTKPVPPLAIVSGVPGRVLGYRDLLSDDAFQDDLERHLVVKYFHEWRKMERGGDGNNK